MIDKAEQATSLIGKTLRVDNADTNLLNVVDIDTNKRYWIESTDKFIIFSSIDDGKENTHDRDEG